MSQTADNKHVKPVNQRRCRDEITIVLANCDRVTGKKSSIENMLVSLDPDIFLAVETKLDNTVQNGEILLPQYNSSPNDRKRGGGGVLVASKDNIITEALPDYDTNCELCWIKIHLEGAKTLIVGVLYRPPDSPRQCLHELSLSLTRIRVKYPDAILMLGGDFNLPGIDWQSMSHVPSRPKKAESELLLSTIQDFHMDQLNTEPTRGSSILELVLSSCPKLVTSCTTGPGISDHDHVVIVRASVRAKQNTKKPRFIHLFRNVNWENIKSFLRSAETQFFQTCHETSSVDTNWQFFRDTITQAIEKFVPKKKVSGRFSLPWLTRPVKRLIRRKQRAYNRAKKSNKDRDWEIFRKLRKKSQSSLKQTVMSTPVVATGRFCWPWPGTWVARVQRG